nr:putative exosome complex exonuclease RRP40 [Cryptomonas curvata]
MRVFSTITINYYQYIMGNSFLGFIIGFTEERIFVYIGYHKIVVVFGTFNNTKIKKQTSMLFFRIENEKICEIRQKIKNLKNINSYRGYFGLLNGGKIYRLTMNMSINLTKQFKKLKKLKTIGRKYEFEFALGINGYIWINQLKPVNMFILLEFILNAFT